MTGSQSHLVFVVQDACFAVDVTLVERVIRAVALTRVPGEGAGLLGVLDLHGAPVPVVDLRTRLGLPPSARSLDERIVVCDNGNGPVAFMVDAIVGVVDLDPDELEWTSGLAHQDGGPVFQGIAHHEGRLVYVCDLSGLLGTSPPGSRAEPPGDRDGRILSLPASSTPMTPGGRAARVG